MFETKEVPIKIGDVSFTLVLDVELELVDNSFDHEFGTHIIANYEVKSFKYEIKENINLEKFNIDSDFIEDIANEELENLIDSLEDPNNEDNYDFDTYEEMYG